MTNREKYAVEILDIACSGGAAGVTTDGRLENCSDIKCRNCKFFFSNGESRTCSEAFAEWCKQEYVYQPIEEMATRICRYIKTEINPYSKPFEGTVYEFGLKIMNYVKSIVEAEKEE